MLAPMTIHLSMRKKLAAVGVGAAVLLGTGGAVAWAQTSGPPSTTTPGTTAPPAAPVANQKPAADAGRGPVIRAIGRRTVHADLVVQDKSGAFVTVTIDRGTVSAVNATSITLDRADGKQATLTIDTNTKVHGVASVPAVQTGKMATVVSRDGTATQIVQAKA
jgi:hypothetical protein